MFSPVSYTSTESPFCKDEDCSVLLVALVVDTTAIPARLPGVQLSDWDSLGLGVAQRPGVARESEFGGLDWSTGLELWTTGMEYWITGME